MSLVCRSIVAVGLLLVTTSCTSDDDVATSTSSIVGAPTTVPTTAAPVTAPTSSPTNSSPDLTTNGTFEHPAAARLDCADPIEVIDAPPESLEVIGGAIALQTTRSFSTPLQLGRAVGTGASALQFAKTGLVVRTGEQVEIIVVPAPGRTALVWWGNTGNSRPAERFIVGPCASGAGWLVFPGGYWVSEPGCVSLVVRHEDVDAYVTVALGGSCVVRD
jgi:hypothetical protein